MPRYQIEKVSDQEKKGEFQYAIFSALKMVIGGVITGLALAIAIVLQIPINILIVSLGITDLLYNSLLTILIYFIFAVLFVLLLLWIAKKEQTAMNK